MYPANVPELEAGFPAELLDVMLHVQILIENAPMFLTTSDSTIRETLTLRCKTESFERM